MLNKLKHKWKVGAWQLFLILCTFAIGGSLSGLAGRWILAQFSFTGKAVYIILYIILVTLIWPFMVLVISLFFGQFYFFQKYLKQMFRKIAGKKSRFTSILSLSAIMLQL